jgi:cell division protein FtsZ
MTLHEVSEATRIIQESADSDANIIFGSVFDDSVGDKIKITVIATGFELPSSYGAGPLGDRNRRRTIFPFERAMERRQLAPQEVALPEGEESFDVPAFLRKKAD